MEKSVCSLVKLGPEKTKRDIHKSKGWGGDVGELTGGDFVAEAEETKLVVRIAPPSVRAGRYIGRRVEPDGREAVIWEGWW